MIPLFKVRMSPDAIAKSGEVLSSGFIGQGPKYDELETKLGLEFYKKPILTNSCSSSLLLALKLAGVGSGDFVISSPQTCFASNAAIIETGANICWADTDPITGNISVDSVRKWIGVKNPKAIMAVNWAGRPCDFKALKSFGIPVIEDAAHNMVSPRGNNHGDYVCYSLGPIKFWTSGDGGVLFTPEDKYDLAYTLNWYGLDRRVGNSFRCSSDILNLGGFKYHMNDIAASIALANYDEARDSVIKHKQNAKDFIEAFKDLPTITCPPWQDDCDFWIFTLLVEKGTKEQFIEHLVSKGVSCNPVHRRNDTFSCVKDVSMSMQTPGLDNFYNKQVSIPVGWWLSPEDKERIIKAVKSYGH